MTAVLSDTRLWQSVAINDLLLNNGTANYRRIFAGANNALDRVAIYLSYLKKMKQRFII